MNFWEARQAALSGKKVKVILKTMSAVYSPVEFLSITSWTRDVIEADWEVVEEKEEPILD
jgi:hypothetical protein